MKKIILFLFAFVAMTATFTCCEKSVIDEYDGTRAEFNDSTNKSGVQFNFNDNWEDTINVDF